MPPETPPPASREIRLSIIIVDHRPYLVDPDGTVLINGLRYRVLVTLEPA